MIKKSIIAAFALMAFAAPVCAQTGTMEETIEQNKIETKDFRGNWFVSVGAGAQMYVGDHDRQIGFGDRLSPALDVAVGKWISPVLGARVEYSGLSLKGATRWGAAHSTGEQVPGWGVGMNYSKFNYSNLHADMMVNLHNWIKGYQSDRVWNSIAYVGLGWIHTGEAPKCNALSGNAGWLNTFRLCSWLDANVDLKAVVVDDSFDGEDGGASLDGILSLSVGLTYKF